MRNKALLTQITKILNEIDEDELENVQIESILYDDGAEGYDIEITFKS